MFVRKDDVRMSRAQRSKTQKASGAKSQLDLFSVSLNVDAKVPRPAAPRPVADESRQVISPNAAGGATAAPAQGIDARLRDYVMGAQPQRGRPFKILRRDDHQLSDEHRLLDVREAAMRLGLSKSTLDKMRCSGRGPRFIRATDRAIRYDPADLQAFADGRRRRSTSELASLLTD
jgi:predicted DNA-binding transcriptional regulator AlpA